MGKEKKEIKEDAYNEMQEIFQRLFVNHLDEEIRGIKNDVCTIQDDISEAKEQVKNINNEIGFEFGSIKEDLEKLKEESSGEIGELAGAINEGLKKVFDDINNNISDTKRNLTEQHEVIGEKVKDVQDRLEESKTVIHDDINAATKQINRYLSDVHNMIKEQIRHMDEDMFPTLRQEYFDRINLVLKKSEEIAALLKEQNGQLASLKEQTSEVAPMHTLLMDVSNVQNVMAGKLDDLEETEARISNQENETYGLIETTSEKLQSSLVEYINEEIGRTTKEFQDDYKKRSCKMWIAFGVLLLGDIITVIGMMLM